MLSKSKEEKSEEIDDEGKEADMLTETGNPCEENEEEAVKDVSGEFPPLWRSLSYCLADAACPPV